MLWRSTLNGEVVEQLCSKGCGYITVRNLDIDHLRQTGNLTVQDTQCNALRGLCHSVHYDNHTSTHSQAAYPLSWTPGPPAAPPLNTGRSLSGQLCQTGWTLAYWCGCSHADVITTSQCGLHICSIREASGPKLICMKSCTDKWGWCYHLDRHSAWFLRQW